MEIAIFLPVKTLKSRGWITALEIFILNNRGLSIEIRVINYFRGKININRNTDAETNIIDFGRRNGLQVR
jgi:hypothetical protein